MCFGDHSNYSSRCSCMTFAIICSKSDCGSCGRRDTGYLAMGGFRSPRGCLLANLASGIISFWINLGVSHDYNETVTADRPYYSSECKTKTAYGYNKLAKTVVIASTPYCCFHLSSNWWNSSDSRPASHQNSAARDSPWTTRNSCYWSHWSSCRSRAPSWLCRQLACFSSCTCTDIALMDCAFCRFPRWAPNLTSWLYQYLSPIPVVDLFRSWNCFWDFRATP